MTLRPGRWPWLLRHEMRLAWRHAGSERAGLLVALGGFVWLGAHVAVYWLLRLVDTRALGPDLFLLALVLSGCTCALMLSHAITLSVGVLFDRGDFDLLLASPLEPRAVFIVRALGVVLAVAALPLAVVSPFADAGLLTRNANLVALYPAVAFLALLATACGMALTLGLVRLLGARRARTAAQLLGAFVGAALFLALQANNLVDAERSRHWIEAFRDVAGEGGWLGPARLLRAPLDAMLGRPTPLALLGGVAVASFALVVAATTRRFVAGTQESVSASRRPTAALAAVAPFRTGLRSVVLGKEWKLIGRDPQLIAQTVLQTLYLLPIVFVWSRSSALAAVLTPATVVGAATLTANLAWLTIAAEDAPELIATAPVSLARVRCLKLAAAVLPVWLLVLPIATVLVATRAGTASVFIVAVCGSTLAAGTIQLCIARPGERKNLRRRGSGDWLANGYELVTTAAWAVLAWCLLAAPGYAWLAAMPALAGPWLAMHTGRRRKLATDT